MLTHFDIYFGQKLVPFLVKFYLKPTKLIKTPAKKSKLDLELIRVNILKKTLANLQPIK